MKNRNRIAAGALVVAGLASTAFAGAFAPEAEVLAPGANIGYMVSSYVTDDPVIQNGAAGAGGAAGGLLAAWAGAKIGGKFGAVLGGPVGAIGGAFVGAA